MKRRAIAAILTAVVVLTVLSASTYARLSNHVVLHGAGTEQAFAAHVPLMVGAMPMPGSVSNPVYTHRAVSHINFAGTAQCVQLKKADPKQASNPTLCTATITSLSTDLMPLPGHASTIVPSTESCGGGWQSFDDNYTDPLSSSIEMKTTFTWYYNCQPPTVTYKHCWINWLVGVLQHESCDAETPNPNYSDVMHSVQWNPYAQPWLYVTIWQERTAYWYGGIGYCTDLSSGC